VLSDPRCLRSTRNVGVDRTEAQLSGIMCFQMPSSRPVSCAARARYTLQVRPAVGIRSGSVRLVSVFRDAYRALRLPKEKKAFTGLEAGTKPGRSWCWGWSAASRAAPCLVSADIIQSGWLSSRTLSS